MDKVFLEIFNKVKDMYSHNIFLRNFSVLSLGEFSSRFFTVVTNVLVARYLAPQNYGIYSLALTYVAIFGAVASLGLRQLIIREIARNQGKTKLFLSVSIFFRSVGFLLSFGAFCIYGLFCEQSLSEDLTVLVFFAVFAESVWDMFQNVAFGLQRFTITSILNVSFSAITMFTYLILPKELISIRNVLSIYVVYFLIKDGIYFYCLNKCDFLNGEYDFNIKQSQYRNIFKDSFPFYILVLLGLFTNQFPVIFIEMNTGAEQVAYFNTANKILLPLTMFFNTALAAFFPNQAVTFMKDRILFGRQTKKVLTAIVSMGAICCFVISLFRTEIVYLLYGNAYKATGDVMAYQCWYFVLFAVFCINGSVLGAANQQNRLSMLSIIYAIVSTPILYTASFYGAEGVSVGYIIASSINLLMVFPNIVKVSEGQLKYSYSILLFVCVGISMVISMFLPQSLNIYIRLSILLTIIMAIYFRKEQILQYVKTH